MRTVRYIVPPARMADIRLRLRRLQEERLLLEAQRLLRPVPGAAVYVREVNHLEAPHLLISSSPEFDGCLL